MTKLFTSLGDVVKDIQSFMGQENWRPQLTASQSVVVVLSLSHLLHDIFV